MCKFPAKENCPSLYICKKTDCCKILIVKKNENKLQTSILLWFIEKYASYLTVCVTWINVPSLNVKYNMLLI